MDHVGGSTARLVAERNRTTEIMAYGSDLGVGMATGTAARRPWESYAAAGNNSRRQGAAAKASMLPPW